MGTISPSPHKRTTVQSDKDHNTIVTILEKQLVKELGVSWKEAHDCLKILKNEERDEQASNDEVYAHAVRHLLAKRQVKQEREQLERRQAEREKQERRALKDKQTTETLYVSLNGTVNFAKGTMPESLLEAGVSAETWKQVRDCLVQDLAPALQAARKYQDIVDKGIDNYQAGQVGRDLLVGGILGAVMEAGHEKKMFQKVLVTQYALHNLDVAATNALGRANFLLNPYSVLVQLATERVMPFPKDCQDVFRQAKLCRPIGFKFQTHRRDDAVPLSRKLQSWSVCELNVST